MRPLLITAWLLLPLGALAYHHGPGQDRLARDHAQDALATARAAVAAGDHALAVEAYEQALGELPAGQLAAARRIRLERAKSKLQSGGLFEARDELQGLVTELEADASADPALLTDARTSLANAHFYVTWQLRLEGQPREVWEPEVDAARQHYRLLADASGADRAARERDLASAVRLARMDLDELQGLPLPNE